MTIGECPLAARPITKATPPSVACSGHTEVLEDNKDGISYNFWPTIDKRKVVLAMGETSTNVFNIGRQVKSRHNFSRLLNSISSTSEAIFVIPDDDTQ